MPRSQRLGEYWARARAEFTRERCGLILQRINRIGADGGDDGRALTAVKKLVNRWQSLDCEGSLVGRD